MSEQKKMDAERAAFEAAYADSQGFEEKAYSLWFKKIGGEYEIAQVASAWWGWQQARASLPVGVPDDRATLLYLMDRFDNEEWSCARCGHSEATHDMDSAIYLREYLAALAAAPTVKAEPFELRLCEQYHTVLQPDRHYLFTVDPNCEKCAAIARGEAPSLPAAGSAVEEGEVVAYLFIKPDGKLSMDAVRHKPRQAAEPVVTVAQQQRIDGQRLAEIERIGSELRAVVGVLSAVQEQFNRYGERFPDGFDSRVFRWVDDAVAGHALSAQQSAPERVSVPVALLRVACSGGNEAWQALEELRALLASHGRGEA